MTTNIRIRRPGPATVIWSCLAASLLCTPPVVANPTGQLPNRPLAVHGTIPEAKDQVARLYKLYEEEEKYVTETYARRLDPDKFSDKQISKSYGRIWKAIRDAEHLKLMGEPAGEDLSKKFRGLPGNLEGFGISYRSTPRGAPLVQRIEQNLNRSKPQVEKFLNQAEAALQQEAKLEIFERQMEAKGIELYEQMVFFSAVARMPYIGRFDALMSKGDQLLRAKRKREYLERATEVMAEHVATAAEFGPEASRIGGEIAAGGSATLGEGKTGGPVEAFAYVGNLWGTASAALLRATAIQWAFTNRSETQLPLDPKQLKELALPALASIVEAAAASTPAEQVQAVYTDLLKEMSVIDRRIGPFSHDVSNACEPALGKLAAKDPQLSARINAYQRATSEALRWRKQFAYQQAKNLGNNFPEAATLLNAQSEVTSSIRTNVAPKITGPTTVAPAALVYPANWIVHEAATRLTGKPISADRLIRLNPTSRTAIVPYEAHHYGNVPVPLPSDAETADLRTALVVDDTHGPLTIESAAAVSAADMQDYVSVSGLVETVHLEAVVTRFIALPDVAYSLESLGRTPVLDENIPPREQTCWRLDIKPMWAHHGYFTVRTAAVSE